MPTAMLDTQVRVEVPDALWIQDRETIYSATKIPGVHIDEGDVVCWPDALPAVRRHLGFPEVPVPKKPLRDPATRALRGGTALRPYQRRGALGLARGKYVGLVYPCGTGKTPTVLAGLKIAGVDKALVVTRGTGRRSYTRDARWCSGLRVREVKGRKFDPDKPPQLAGTDVDVAYDEAQVLAVGYEVLEHRLSDLGSLKFDAIVFDELHLAKSLDSRQGEACNQLSKNIDLKWGVTATPIRDRRRDLVGQLHLLTPDRWVKPGKSLDNKGQWPFLIRYCGARQGPWGWYTDGPSPRCFVPESMSQELNERLAYYFDIRTKRELAPDLPSKTRQIIRVENCARFDRGGSYENRLLAACEAKTSTLVEEAIDALNEGAKVVICTGRNKHVGTIAQKLTQATNRLQGLKKHLWLRHAFGDQSQDHRLALVDEYMAQQGPACFVTGYDWFGESIDVQDTDVLLVGMIPWTPYRVDQLEGRIHRIGLSRPCVVRYVVAEGTVDEEVEDLLLSKLESVEGAGVAIDGTEWDRAKVPTEEEMLSRLQGLVK